MLHDKTVVPAVVAKIVVVQFHSVIFLLSAISPNNFELSVIILK